MKVTISGDFCQRYRVEQVIREGGYGQLFNDVLEITSKSDFNILNFEFPIVEKELDAAPIKKCGPHLRGSIESIDALKYAGFNVCTLANNHILDQGEYCCSNTKRLLNNAGIKTVGAGDNYEEASETLYLHKDGATLAVINCCEHEFCISTEKTSGANPLEPIHQYYKILEAKKAADYIMVIVHGGPEFYQLPTPRMQEVYRYFVDCGADVVINHHQHCYSGYEIYNNKPIFYGLGNFCFDNIEKRTGTWVEGFIVELTFEKMTGVIFNLHPFIQCADVVGPRLIKETNMFYKTINELNDIIKDSSKLQQATSDYYDSCAASMFGYHSYENRILSKLNRMGLIPYQHSTKRLFSIWNLIECESHRDKMYHAFRKILGR